MTLEASVVKVLYVADCTGSILYIGLSCQHALSSFVAARSCLTFAGTELYFVGTELRKVSHAATSGPFVTCAAEKRVTAPVDAHLL